MLIIVGLGNRGTQYHHTKHNMGFMVVDYLHSFYNFPTFKAKFHSLISEKVIDNHKIILIKPQTYMNLSGSALVEIKQFYKLANDDFIVIHDDIDLPFLSTRYKTNSSDAGQKGVKDIQNKIGKDIHRLKIGIGRPINSNIDITDYVLSKFNHKELLEIQILCQFIADNFNNLLNKNFTQFTTNLNQRD